MRVSDTEEINASALYSLLDTFAVKGFDVIEQTNLTRDVSLSITDINNSVVDISNSHWYELNPSPYYNVSLSVLRDDQDPQSADATIAVRLYVLPNASVINDLNAVYARNVVISSESAKTLVDYKDLYKPTYNHVIGVNTDAQGANRNYFEVQDSASQAELRAFAARITSSLATDTEMWNRIHEGVTGEYLITYRASEDTSVEVKLNVVPGGESGGDDQNTIGAKPVTLTQTQARDISYASDMFADAYNAVLIVYNGSVVQNPQTLGKQIFGPAPVFDTEPTQIAIQTAERSYFLGGLKQGRVGSYPISYYLPYTATDNTKKIVYSTTKAAVVPDGSIVETVNLDDGTRQTGSLYATSKVISLEEARSINSLDDLLALNPNQVVLSSAGDIFQTPEALREVAQQGHLAAIFDTGTDFNILKSEQGGTYEITYFYQYADGRMLYTQNVVLSVAPEGAVIDSARNNAVWAKSKVVTSTQAKELRDGNRNVLYGAAYNGVGAIVDAHMVAPQDIISRVNLSFSDNSAWNSIISGT